MAISNSQIVKGDQLWLFIAPTAGASGTAQPIAFATSCSLNRSVSTNSISSKYHGNSSYVTPGEGSWTASTEALYSTGTVDDSTTFANLMSACDSNEKVNVTFGYVAGAGANVVDAAAGSPGASGVTGWAVTNGWTGEGYITSLQASGSHGDAATWSVEITGIGPLTAQA